MKYIPGFEGKYSVTKYGNVYSHYREKFLLQSDRGRGYLRVRLEGRTYTVHRLVARTYLPNPDNLPQVNHIDGNKLNNSVDNLEWCTDAYNRDHAIETGLRKVRRVIGYNSDGYGVYYPQLSKVKVDSFNPSHVLYCALEKRGYKHHKGFIWELVDG